MRIINSIDLWTEQNKNHYECFNGAFVDGFDNYKIPFDEYKIIKASNGKEAILKLNELNIYALLLDLNMPNTNGFEVLEYLKNNDLIEKIPVVIITGDDTEETIKKAFSYPILDVLNKPFKEDNIKSILVSIKNFNEKN